MTHRSMHCVRYWDGVRQVYKPDQCGIMRAHDRTRYEHATSNPSPSSLNRRKLAIVLYLWLEKRADAFAPKNHSWGTAFPFYVTTPSQYRCLALLACQASGHLKPDSRLRPTDYRPDLCTAPNIPNYTHSYTHATWSPRPSVHREHAPGSACETVGAVQGVERKVW